MGFWLIESLWSSQKFIISSAKQIRLGGANAPLHTLCTVVYFPRAQGKLVFNKQDHKT